MADKVKNASNKIDKGSLLVRWHPISPLPKTERNQMQDMMSTSFFFQFQRKGMQSLDHYLTFECSRLGYKLNQGNMYPQRWGKAILKQVINCFNFSTTCKFTTIPFKHDPKFRKEAPDPLCCAIWDANGGTSAQMADVCRRVMTYSKNLPQTRVG
ncbi:hypothetical protein H6P81_005757 [Aristolochia fimbriata]|uniref:Uncharacterized protein n=1 Tax=Aristolochia fimbriata TaxID=158543 RepID=A0AAV7EZX1_ARIFI|nr:hypothetical protein H6P81_005757 [Aristolochia fimbriata]